MRVLERGQIKFRLEHHIGKGIAFEYQAVLNVNGSIYRGYGHYPEEAMQHLRSNNSWPTHGLDVHLMELGEFLHRDFQAVPAVPKRYNMVKQGVPF